MREPTQGEQDRLLAAIDMVKRTGAREVGIRYQDDEEPVVWVAVAMHGVNKHGVPIASGGEITHTVAAALDPIRAVLRLAEELVDGSQCKHCGRPAGLEPDSIDTMPLNDAICWYQYDPELKTFRRGCE